MNKNSVFILCQYTNKNGFLLKEIFKVIKEKRVLLNIPPTIVYILKKR